MSRALGGGDDAKAAELGGAGLILMLATMIVMTALMMAFTRPMLELIGAGGETLDIAVRFMLMVLPSMPLMAAGMSAAGLLRAKGDAAVRCMSPSLPRLPPPSLIDPDLWP